MRRFWTPARLSLVEELIDSGLSDPYIGRQLGCTANAVNIARKRHGIASRRRAMMTARTIQVRLGIGCSKTVAKWIQRGYLKAKRGQRVGKNRMWYVTEDAILAFLEDPRTWPLWKTERITDNFLRAWATDVRTENYLTVGEVAQRCSVGRGAVNDWIHRGTLPATRWGNWCVRERDLVGFTPPCERSKKGLKKRRFTAAEDAVLLTLREAGATWRLIADQLGRALGSVAGRHQRLTT